jgi:1-acyl-sn-glycerol-3-phosphate acyltransferase
MKFLIKLILIKILGWKTEKKVEIPKKCVLIVAPHTSAWDFILGYCFAIMYDIKANFLIKEEFFFFPVGYLIKAMGAIPVNRRKNILVKQLVAEFDKRKNLNLIITIEGTRKKTKNWKKGYSLIASNAEVPIVVGRLDYGRKLMTADYIYEHNDERIHDMKFVKSHFDDIQGKFADNFTNE